MISSQEAIPLHFTFSYFISDWIIFYAPGTTGPAAHGANAR